MYPSIHRCLLPSRLCDDSPLLSDFGSPPHYLLSFSGKRYPVPRSTHRLLHLHLFSGFGFILVAFVLRFALIASHLVSMVILSLSFDDIVYAPPLLVLVF